MSTTAISGAPSATRCSGRRGQSKPNDAAAADDAIGATPQFLDEHFRQ
jgi:hypothetical protein